MTEVPTQKITQLLADWCRGDERAAEVISPLVYQELRRLARSHMRRERRDHTLQSTALVHEAYLRLVDQRIEWKSRAHFFAIAAQMMRRILVDHAKKSQAKKRGAGTQILSLDEPLAISNERGKDLLALDDALSRLTRSDPQRGRIVELRFFGGLSNEESAQVLGMSPASVQRQWAGARAWLHHEMSHQDAD